MGNICGLGDQDPIKKNLKEDRKKNSMTSKVLLLGIGDSGKTTVFKQMQIVYQRQMQATGRDLSADRRKNAIHYLVSGGVEFFTIVAESSGAEIINYIQGKTELSEALQVVTQRGIERSHSITPDLGRAFETLWGDERIKDLWENTWPESSLGVTWGHFADEFVANWNHKDPKKRWGTETWTPTIEDDLLLRVRTTGINRAYFCGFERHPSLTLEMIDVGGQRSERPKWVHLVGAVQVILYVAAVSEYNQNLYEENTFNRFKECLNVYNSVLSDDKYKGLDTDFVVFLNKTDILERKLQKRISIASTGQFEDAPIGDQEFDLEANKKWIEQQFVTRFEEHRPNKDWYGHFTTATNTRNLRTFLDMVHTMVFDKIIRGFGF